MFWYTPVNWSIPTIYTSTAVLICTLDKGQSGDDGTDDDDDDIILCANECELSSECIQKKVYAIILHPIKTVCSKELLVAPPEPPLSSSIDSVWQNVCMRETGCLIWQNVCMRETGCLIWQNVCMRETGCLNIQEFCG